MIDDWVALLVGENVLLIAGLLVSKTANVGTAVAYIILALALVLSGAAVVRAWNV